MNEPVGIFTSLGGTILMGLLFLSSIVLIVIYAINWRHVKPECKHVTGLLILGLFVLFSWFTQVIYIDSIWSVSKYRIVVPLWLPCLAIGVQLGLTIMARCIGIRAKKMSNKRIQAIVASAPKPDS